MSTAIHNPELFPTSVPELPEYWNDEPAPSKPDVVSVRRRVDSTLPVLMAIADPVLAPEVSTVVAATGRGVVESVDPRDIARLGGKVAVVLTDPTTAPALASVPPGTTKVVLFPEPGPVDFELAMRVHADHALVVPAQAPELLQIIGRSDVAGSARGTVTAVIGAVGGAGASTLAVAMAMVIPDGVVVDAVPDSGGLDLLLGVEDSAGVRFNDVALGSGTIAAADLKNALPHTRTGQAVLTNARLAEESVRGEDIAAAVNLLVTTGDVVIDCPYSGEEAHAAISACDHAVVIVPSEIRAVARAKNLVERLRRERVQCVLVMRHRGWSGLSAQEIETITGAPVIAELPTIKKLAKTAELNGLDGALPAGLQKCAQRIHDHLAGGVR